jgi:hypothetical protein
MLIYSDKSYLPEGARHIELLNAFWGPFGEISTNRLLPDLWRDGFSTMNSIFSLTDQIKMADFMLLPGDWKQYQRRKREDLGHKYTELAGRNGKNVLVLYHHDSAEKIPLKNAIILRTSLCRSKKSSNEYPMPAWHTDYIHEYLGGQVCFRPKTTPPVVGFCGHAKPDTSKNWVQNLQHLLYRWVRGNPSFDYLNFRKKILIDLTQYPDIYTNFIIRDKYLGGGIKANGDYDLQAFPILQKEYFDNMISSDYVLCVRGAGNYSFRFYETLCCGRIPIFIDTDCILPFENHIQWSKYIIRIDKQDISNIGDIVSNFHDRISPDAFLKLQQDCRNLWLNWFSPKGFFNKFFEYTKYITHS